MSIRQTMTIVWGVTPHNSWSCSISALEQARGGTRDWFVPDEPVDLHAKVTGRAIAWPGVQVAASRGDRFMAQGRLHKVNRAAPIEGVAGVGVSEPVRADPRPYSGPPSSGSDYTEDL